jgi:hypothetical protein
MMSGDSTRELAESPAPALAPALSLKSMGRRAGGQLTSR